MGIYDRDYVRDDEGGYGGGPWSMVSKLVALNVGIFLAHILFFPTPAGQPEFANPLNQLFGLKADLFTHPWQFYQLLTYGFLHSTTQVWHIIGNMLILWFLGRDVEMIYGKRTFLELYLSTIILSGLVWTIFTYLQAAPFTRGQVPLLVGASGGVWGVAMVFVMHYPRKTIYLNFLIPVPIWLMAAIYLFFDLVATIKQENGGVATVAHLSGAALGYLFYRTRWQLGVLLPTRLFQALRRPQVRIHREEEPDDDAMLKEEVDRILEKISREGEASLTTRERRTLEDASRRFQKRRR